MPALRSHRQGSGRQRHHKSRLGRILVPHGRLSGLLWTVNPLQESKALRELQLYLHPLIEDLERAQNQCDSGVEAKSGSGTDTASGPDPSTSSLLSAELASYRPDSAGVEENGEENEMQGRTSRKRARTDEYPECESSKGKRRWLSPLETCCKGHLMVSIPFPSEPQSATTGGGTQDERVRGSGATGAKSLDSHSVVHNPLVRMVVERIFRDVEENQRPVLRHCFRLVPCELTCCPVLSEMRTGLELLLNEHFPSLPTEPQRLHKVGLSFSVKNNTNVNRTKAYLQAALETVFPANRFAVVPSGRMKECGGGVEAMFCVIVVHSTCVMGVQRHFSERGDFNIHALGAKHLELSSSV